MMGGRMPFGGAAPFGHHASDHEPQRAQKDTSEDIIEGDFEERPARHTPLDKKD